MIVADDTVSKALAYLADDPHPIAEARHAMTLAENEAKANYAAALLRADGSVEVKKALAEIDNDHQTAKLKEANALRDVERHRARMKAAEMIIEVWRSENANARAAERVR